VPNDPRLAALPALCGDAPPALDGFTLQAPQLVQYVPELRATARVNAAGHDGLPQTLFAKTSHDATGGATHAAMRTLADSAAARAGRLRLPRSIAWQPAQGLHWQAGVPGIALLDHPAQGTATLAARVGAMVAALHGSEAPVARHATAAQLQQRLREVIDLLWFVNPRWHAALERIGRTLGEQVAAMDLAVGATLHGDLHPRNLLVDGEDLWLIDLDSLWLGAPVLDLGAWLADGLYRELLEGSDPQRGEAAREAFVAAYREGSQRHVDPRALQAAVLYQLVCERAQRCVTTLKPGRFEHLGELIERADAMAAPLRWRSAA
jgi:aminoglycoside phosphotransferase (APT) family kinase protein